MKVAVIAVACLLQVWGVVNGANPNYSYHVKIDDPSYVNFQEKAETRKGEDAQGFYSVLEPNGALRTVQYTADERGFNPIVSYSYGHPQSAVTVTSAAGPAAIVKQPGVYAPAYVADNRVQIVDKSNIYAAPPPALNLQTFSLPGPSSPVIVPAPLRVAAPVVKASAAIATNYAPAYVPSPNAYLPPPQQQVIVQQQPQVLVKQQPQVLVQQPQVVVRQPQVVVRQPQVIVRQQPQVLAIPQPQRVAVAVQQPAVAFTKVVQPAKYLTAPVAKVVKTVVRDSYSEAPRNTFRDPNAASYSESVRLSEPVAEYGPPSYVPPPPLYEPAPVKVVQQQVAVQKVVAAPPPAIVQQVVAAPVQKVVAAPPPAIAVQKVVAAPPPALNLYAGAIGFHNVQSNADSYLHAYGTQGFQVTSSRKFNKAVYTPTYAVAQKVVQPAPVYGPPPAVAVAQKVVQPAPVYGPPAYAVAQKVVQPAPVYGPPPAVAVAQQIVQPAPAPVVQQVALPAPPPVVQSYVSAPVALPPPPPAPVAVAQVAPAPLAAAPIAIAGKKQNPLTFAYSYDQGGAKVTHSYSGSGW